MEVKTIKVLIVIFMLGFMEQTFAQNPRNDNKAALQSIHQYINEKNLAICLYNYRFVGVYQNSDKKMVYSIFSGNHDIINDIKVIASKIYYIAGLTECSDKEFNKVSTTSKFHIDLGNNNKVRYYNFAGTVRYKNRNLIHYQTTDILNPPHMNAKYKSIDIVYDNIYFPEAYGSDYDYKLNYKELAKQSIETLYNNFQKIENEYKKL